MSIHESTYLGDGAYACYENGMIKIWTSDGVNLSTPIYFEPEVFRLLIRFAFKIDYAEGTTFTAERE